MAVQKISFLFLIFMVTMGCFIDVAVCNCYQENLIRTEREGTIDFRGRDYECTWTIQNDAQQDDSVLVVYLQSMDMLFYNNNCKGYLFIPESGGICRRYKPYCRIYTSLHSKCDLDRIKVDTLENYKECHEIMITIKDDYSKIVHMNNPYLNDVSFSLVYRYISCSATSTASASTLPQTKTTISTTATTKTQTTTKSSVPATSSPLSTISQNFGTKEIYTKQGNTSGSIDDSEEQIVEGSHTKIIIIVSLIVLLIVSSTGFVLLLCRQRKLEKKLRPQTNVGLGSSDSERSHHVYSSPAGHRFTFANFGERETVVNVLYGEGNQIEEGESNVYSSIDRKF